MKARSVIVGGALTALVIGSGCVVKVDFNPAGNDFEIAGSWTLNGAPPTAASCTEANIESVRLVFYDGGSPYFYDELSAPCEEGSFNTGRIWRWGNYRTQWEAVRFDGTVIRDDRGIMPLVVQSPVTMANTSWDIVADVTPVFDPTGTDDSLSADWTINGGAPDTTTCANAGIDHIEITLFAEDDVDYTNGVVVASAPCDAGKYDSRDPGEPGAIVRDGRYLTSIDALDGGGAVIASFRFDGVLDTTAVTHAMLATADYVTPTTLVINFGWDTDPTTTMSDGTCVDAAVATYSYMLNDAGGALIDSQEAIACQDQLVFTPVDPGTYSIYIEGADASGAKRWMVTCSDMVVADGEYAEYNCSVEDTSGT